MNYDTILLEMLSRIQTLEEKVGALEEAVRGTEEPAAAPAAGKAGGAKVTTADIRAFIRGLLRDAREAGEETLILRAGDIHRAMGLVSRVPPVCDAMRQCMRPGDRVLFETPSGKSTTLEILYELSGREDE